MNTTACPQGHDNPPGNTYCGICGSALRPQPTGTPPTPPSDTVGAVPSDGPLAPPPPVMTIGGRKSSSRRRVAIVALALVVVGVGSWLLVRDPMTTDEKYLEALEQANLDTEFRTDQAAIIAAKEVCENAELTGDPKGGEAAQIGVTHFCPAWAADFQVLETVTVDGSFELWDTDAEWYTSSCDGDGGYGDITSSTRVLVTNRDGDTLARTSLGPGVVDSESDYVCRFEFSFDITEGEETYVVSVGDRGESDMTFAELKNAGVHLTLGL